MILREPRLEDEKEILSMCEEIKNSKDEVLFEGVFSMKNITNFKDWLKKIEEDKSIEEKRSDLVNQTTYILVDENNHILGGATIRHRLNEKLLEHGGNLGHNIRPSERRKGYGTIIMHLEFEKCKELGINKALITARTENIASNKLIQKCGGVEDKPFTDPQTHKTYRRYWLDIR